MTYVLGNGITATFTPSTGSAINFAVTGFSRSGGDRPEIDVTVGTDSRRIAYAGLASPEEYTLTVKFDGEDLTAEMAKCGSGSLQVYMNLANACSTSPTASFLGPIDVHLVSFNHSVELDGILEGEVTFRRQH